MKEQKNTTRYGFQHRRHHDRYELISCRPPLCISHLISFNILTFAECKPSRMHDRILNSLSISMEGLTGLYCLRFRWSVDENDHDR